MHSAEGGRDLIESRIDAALASYAEPPSMPDARVAAAQVMARLAERDAPRRRWWLWVAPAAACLLLLVLALGVGRMMRAPGRPQIASAPLSSPASGPVSAAVPKSVSGPMENGKISAPVRRPGRRVNRPTALTAREQALPKLDVFPTPAPLSPEEQGLVTLATKAPPNVQQQVIAAEQHIADAINIAELTIRPLDQGDQQKSRDEREKP